MKTMFLLLVTGLLTAAPIHAQNACLPVAGGYGCALAYPMPVIYQAAVAYMGPVIYPAPVYCLSPAVAQCRAARQPVSTVIYIGGDYSRTRNYYANCNSGTQVIYFGGQQACRQGYQFNRPR
ncbi:MAG: hypothetical protein JWR69_2559 [Pedosphaera sp.]|nr:hypothetical protein [Pedosphaera sp.]